MSGEVILAISAICFAAAMVFNSLTIDRLCKRVDNMERLVLNMLRLKIDEVLEDADGRD